MGVELGMLEEPDRHGGHRAPALNPFPLNESQHLRRVEAADVEHDPPAGERLGDQGRERPDVEQRRGHQVHRLRRVRRNQVRQLPGPRQHVLLVGHHRPERQLDRLRHPGAAGGEQDDRRVFLIVGSGHVGDVRSRGPETVSERGDVEHRRSGGNESRRIGDHSAGVDEPDRVVRLAGAPPPITQHWHRACRPDGPQCQHPIRAVVGEQHHAVAGLDPGSLQQCACLRGSAEEPAVGDAPAALDQEFPVRPARNAVQQFGKGLRPPGEDEPGMTGEPAGDDLVTPR